MTGDCLRRRVLTSQINKVTPKLFIHNCNRCNHKWIGKLAEPKTCANPKCRTPYWNKPRIRKQNKRVTFNEKYYFIFERDDPAKSYSFSITNNQITCEECDLTNCNHVFEIITDSKIRLKINERGIEFSPEYENSIKELGKNIIALKEFVETPD